MEGARRSYGLQSPGTRGVPGAKRYGMVVDLRKCIGCMSCAVACKAEFGIPLGSWRTWVKVMDKGRYPNTRRVFMPSLCNHCDYPVCVRNCPTQATYKHKDGFVLQRYNRCIGCRTCMVACPYNARHMLPAKRTDNNLPHMVVDKCTFCVHRVKKGLVPACVQACVGGARIFGDMNDPDSEVAKLASTERLTVLKPELGTSPSVSYIGSDWEIMDEPLSYTNRSAQLKEEYNDYKRNHEGDTFADIIEGEPTMPQVGQHAIGFLKTVPHKASDVLKAFKIFLFG
ncbi:MAG: 4Fe-4S dicluster domain-containing protein [Magnetococcales bacterium]|nr:4Fe-4S dicluster domain-containing protein [Magnetococcales bacterium]